MSVSVRQATEADVAAIREIFHSIYGDDYPYQQFYDEGWLKRSVYTDDIAMLVAVDDATGDILGTASVVLDIGAHSDLIGEFGRLAVSPEARGRGVGRTLMQARIEFVENRLHVGLVENRVVHPYSQRISRSHGFQCVGFLPMKHRFQHRESIALYVRHFGHALDLRRNHPRIVPEVHPLAHLALERCGLTPDAIVDEDSPSYPTERDFEVDDLTTEGFPSLVRIERGRVRNRELFGPMRLQYGFFKLTAKHARYRIAREPGNTVVSGAIGYVWDDIDRAIKVFELIVRDEQAIRFLLTRLLDEAGALGAEYVEIDCSAHAPRMQRTLVELGFLPAAYVPAMVFHQVERLDVVRMVKLLVPLDLGPLELIEESRIVTDQVVDAFARKTVLPRIASALDRIGLFEGLSEEQAQRVAGTCAVRDFRAGDSLFRAGEPALEMFVLLRGSVRVLRDGQAVGTVFSGEVVGEVALLTSEDHSATVQAEADGVAAVISRADLQELTRLRPDIAVVLYRNTAIALGRKLRGH